MDIFILLCTKDESEKDDEDEVSFAEVPRALKEFLERSSLGEFEARLGILRSFHCHAMYLGTEDSVDRKPAYQGRAGHVGERGLLDCLFIL